MVEEQVLFRSRVDESEALIRQSLDRTFCHFVQSLRMCPAALPENTVLMLRRRKRIIVSTQRARGDGTCEKASVEKRAADDPERGNRE
jgi:hypothetical protein